jgi:hypothetical protein
MRGFFESKTVDAPSVELASQTTDGKTICMWTMTTKATRCVAFFVTDVTQAWVTLRTISKYFFGLSST